MEKQLFSTYFLPITLAIIMVGMGLSLTVADFKRIFKSPKGLAIGLISQMVFLPLIAYLLIFKTNFSPEMKVGFVLIAACPGGATANLISHLLKANVALCISMTVINSFLTQLTIPLILNLALFVFMGETETSSIQLPFGPTILKIFLITLLPITIGVFIRNKIPDFSQQLDKPLRYILPVLLGLVFLGVMFLDSKQNPVPLSEYLYLVPAALALNVLGMVSGVLAARVFGLPKEDHVTIAAEVGLQNSTLAIFVAVTLIGSPQMAVVAVVYGSFTFFTTGFGAWAVQKIGERY